MSLRIQTNIEAYDAHRNLVGTQKQLATAMERLSSGFRINRAADDAAGLAISEKLHSQIGGLDQAARNAQDAVSLVQTGEGALAEVQSMLQRVRDLAVQFNNGTLSASDQAAITAEVAQLCAEISDIGKQTAFNGINLLNASSTITFQVGANDGEAMTVSTVQLFGSAASAQVDSTLFAFSGTVSLSSIDKAIQNVSNSRSTFGSVQLCPFHATFTVSPALRGGGRLPGAGYEAPGCPSFPLRVSPPTMPAWSAGDPETTFVTTSPFVPWPAVVEARLRPRKGVEP